MGTTLTLQQPKIVSREEWLVARKQLITEEKAYTRQYDALAAKHAPCPGCGSWDDVAHEAKKAKGDNQ